MRASDPLASTVWHGRDVRQGAHATCENPPNATTMVSPPWFRLRSGISSSQKRLESVRESSCEGLYRCVAFFRGWQPRTHLFVRSPQRYGPSVSQLKQWRFLLGRPEPTAARSLTAVSRNDRKTIRTTFMNVLRGFPDHCSVGWLYSTQTF